MPSYTVHDAKARLSELIALAERGPEVIVARENVPAVRLVPVLSASLAERVPGTAAGIVVVPEDFDAPLPDEFLAAFR